MGSLLCPFHFFQQIPRAWAFDRRMIFGDHKNILYSVRLPLNSENEKRSFLDGLSLDRERYYKLQAAVGRAHERERERRFLSLAKCSSVAVLQAAVYQ